MGISEDMQRVRAQRQGQKAGGSQTLREQTGGFTEGNGGADMEAQMEEGHRVKGGGVEHSAGSTEKDGGGIVGCPEEQEETLATTMLRRDWLRCARGSGSW